MGDERVGRKSGDYGCNYLLFLNVSTSNLNFFIKTPDALDFRRMIFSSCPALLPVQTLCTHLVDGHFVIAIATTRVIDTEQGRPRGHAPRPAEKGGRQSLRGPAPCSRIRRASRSMPSSPPILSTTKRPPCGSSWRRVATTSALKQTPPSAFRELLWP